MTLFVISFALVVAIAIWLGVWRFAYQNLNKSFPYEFDYKPESFYELLKQFTSFFGTLILIASGSITFLAQSLVAPGGNTSRAILTGWGTGLPLILLAMTVIGALAFIGFLTYYYEDYLHAKYGPENRGEERGRSTYTLFRYSLVLGLGFSAFLFFGLAYLSLVISLAMKIAR